MTIFMYVSHASVLDMSVQDLDIEEESLTLSFWWLERGITFITT